MLNITNHQENANQNHNEISPVRMAIIKKQKTRAGQYLEKRESWYTVGGNLNWYTHYGKEF